MVFISNERITPNFELEPGLAAQIHRALANSGDSDHDLTLELSLASVVPEDGISDLLEMTRDQKMEVLAGYVDSADKPNN